MKVVLSVLAILIMFLQGCVTSPSIKQGDDFFVRKDYVSAVRSYERALTETTDTKARESISQKLEVVKKAITDQYLAEAERGYGSQETATVPLLTEVLAILQKGRVFDDNQGRIATAISNYTKERDSLLARATQLRQKAIATADGYNYEEAAKLVREALAIDPSNAETQNALTAIEERKNSYAAIEEQLASKNLDGAMAAYRELAPKTEKPKPFSEFPLKDQFVDLIKKKVGNLVSSHLWYDAYRLLIQWNLPELDHELAQIKYEGSNYYYNEGRYAMDVDNDFFRAYLCAVKAMELNPKEMKNFTLHKMAKDYVNKSMQRYVAVASFDAPSNDPDAGKQFSDSLISYLYRVLPYGINILERDKIDFALKENRGESQQVGNILGVDLMVTGTVSLFKVDKNVDRRKATVKVQIGEETAENPEFMQMVKMYGPDTALWPKIPSRVIKMAKNQLLSYTKGEGEIKGFAKVSVRIFDTHKGTITFVKDFDASMEKSGEFQDEVKEAGIEYIPLKLPSDTEVKEAMRKKIVSEIAAIVEASFQNREARFLNEANFYLERREATTAMRPLAEGHLYCLMDNIAPDNESFKNINKLIADILNQELPKSRE